MSADNALDFEALYQDAPCGYLSADDDGRIVQCNRTLLGWLGYQEHEVVGCLTWPDLLSIGGRIYYETHYAPLLQLEGEAREIAFELVARDGRRRHVLVTTRPIAGASGKLWQSSVFDASERRAYEKELARKNEELRRALDEIKTLRGLIPVCSTCQKVRTDQDSWIGLEAYVQSQTDIKFSHGICPTCKADFLRTLKPRP